MKAPIFAAALLLSACASPPASKAPAGPTDADLATRISQICALPEERRDAEIEKMRKETGMVLYCGHRE